MEQDVSDSDASQARTIVSELGVSENVRLSEELVSEALGLIADQPDTLDLKIATAALAEIRDAYAMFEPYKQRRKVSIFGSARTSDDDPLYELTVGLARTLAEHGWMAVTGAGPGIMQAGMEGAGREMSIGVSIRLPFETGANSIIAGDEKHVSMKYFFTRKLMLIKESQAFVCMPGGFGTLDEMFELLTLTQTGKGIPVPIVLLDAPGDPFWEGVDTFVREQLIARGLRVGERRRSLHDHQRLRRGRTDHQRLLRQLRLDSIRRRSRRDQDASGSDRRAAGRPQRTFRPSGVTAEPSIAWSRSRSNVETTTRSISIGCRSSSRSVATATSSP